MVQTILNSPCEQARRGGRKIEYWYIFLVYTVQLCRALLAAQYAAPYVDSDSVLD